MLSSFKVNIAENLIATLGFRYVRGICTLQFVQFKSLKLSNCWVILRRKKRTYRILTKLQSLFVISHSNFMGKEFFHFWRWTYEKKPLASNAGQYHMQVKMLKMTDSITHCCRSQAIYSLITGKNYLYCFWPLKKR